MAYQPLLNQNNSPNKEKNQINQYPSLNEINSTPANRAPQLKKENIVPSDVLQYPNSADFPQYNQISNEVQNENIINNNYIDYNKITNVKQINHRGLHQVNSTTFYITTKCCCDKAFQCIYFFFSLSFSFLFLIEFNIILILTSILALVFVYFSILMLCKSYFTTYFELLVHSIKITEKAWCGRKARIYGNGQIDKIEFKVENLNLNSKWYYKYKVKLYGTDADHPAGVCVFCCESKSELFTKEEIEYFNFIMNHHIQKNIALQNL